MLSAKTKKYKVPEKVYTKIGLQIVFAKWWWAFLIPLILIIPAIIWPSSWIWMAVFMVLLYGLYILFWYIQFFGLSRVPQGKMIFERYMYEFENARLLVKKNEKEGMEIKYDNIKEVKKTKDALILVLSPVQFFYLPTDIFNSANDYKLAETILRRKGLLVETAAK